MNRFVMILTFLSLFGLAFNSAHAQAPPRELEGRFHNGVVELDWHHPESDPDPSFYKIYRRGVGDPSFSVIATSTDDKFEDAAFTPNTVYLYQVTAVYFGSVESSPSNTVEVSTGSGGFFAAPPRELEGRFHEGIVRLDWNHPESNTNPSFYKVYRKAHDDTSFSVIGSPVGTEFDDAAVALNSVYLYKVTAVYPINVESGPSNTVEVHTVPDTLEDSNRVGIGFTSIPPNFAFVNQLFAYDAEVATIPPGVPVCFQLEEAPTGMTIDALTGHVHWTPTETGIFEVEIKARTCGDREGEAEQEFRLMVLSALPGRVAGIVRNEAGQGLNHVRVKLFDASHGEFVLRTETNDSGRYVFPFVNPATYFVRAIPENEIYAPQWFDGVRRFEDATPVVVPETTTVRVDFTLHLRDTVEDHFFLTGTVMDTASTPIARAKVMVFRVEDDSSMDDWFDDHHRDHDLVAILFTDSDGRYGVILREGTYIVGAEAEGFIHQFWNHKPTPLEADKIHLTRDTSGIDFNLIPRLHGTGSIAGTIREAEDSTGVRSHVLGFRKDSPGGGFSGFIAFAHSDSSGQYMLEHLPDGFYVILALAEHEFVPTFYSLSGGTPFLDSAAAVHVTGSAVVGIDIFLPEDSADGLNSIVGHIETTSPGKAQSSMIPVAGAIVTITQAKTNKPVGAAISEGDGSYIAPGLAPGTYNVVFQKPGLSSANVPISVSYVNNMPTTTTVNAQLSGQSGSGQIGAMSVRQYWNLISVPVTVADVHKSVLFPSAISSAFRFDALGSYVASDILDYTSGYWLKFPTAQALLIEGTERSSQTISLSSNWNLIGSLSKPVATSTITTNPQGILASHFFGYEGGYAIASVLQPGKGYWVKGKQTGELTMTSGTSAPKATSETPADLDLLNSLTIRDAAGNSQTLYFGSEANEIDIEKMEMPPVAPSEAFDVRFSSERIAEIHPASLRRSVGYPIEIQSARSPLTVSWSINHDAAKYVLTDKSGRPLITNRMAGKGSIRLSSAETSRLVLKVMSQEIPKQFALHQNFPNPFNPTTNITFDVPVAAKVSLKVYNLLGQEVATLLEASELGAGQQTLHFDGSKLPSGVYFYRLVADGGVPSFVNVKKMILVK